ncbi:MAG TPA: class I SAM-dependent methyltransferase [Acidimicrobiales bacterium]|jgi:SAM-dependent methyltransferase|nr:class I SAM-dependent methyltransferase [Acidimicrobiales bacterium]
MSDEIEAGGYHWQEQARVERTAEFSTERAAGFRQLMEHLPDSHEVPIRFVDLGAGDGIVASIVLSEYPFAVADLVDFSESMIEAGRRKMQEFSGRYRYVIWDMNDGPWPDDLCGPFDAAVSSAAIHHLANDRKRWLASEIFERLVPRGVFYNFDLFRNADAVFGPDDVHGATCASVEEATSFLVEAGFAEVELDAATSRTQHQAVLAVMSGCRP